MVSFSYLLKLEIFSYNWVLLENEVDTFKSDSKLLYRNKEINNYTIIKKG